MECPAALRWLLKEVVGAEWPGGDEDECRAQADQWKHLAQTLQQLGPVVNGARNKALEGFGSGEFHEYLADQLSHIPGGLDTLIKNFENLEGRLRHVAGEIETAKRAFIIALTALAASVVLSFFLGPLVDAVAVGVARAAIYLAIRTAVGRIVARVAASVLAKLATKPLAEAVVQATVRTTLVVGKGAAIGAGSMAGFDVTSQGLQIAAGDRKGFDLNELGRSTLSGAIMGGVGAPVAGITASGLGRVGARIGGIAPVGARIVTATQKPLAGFSANFSGMAAAQYVQEGKVDLSHVAQTSLAFSAFDPVMHPASEKINSVVGDRLGVAPMHDVVAQALDRHGLDTLPWRDSPSTPGQTSPHPDAVADRGVDTGVHTNLDGGPTRSDPVSHPPAAADPNVGAAASHPHGGTESAGIRSPAPEARAAEPATPGPRPETATPRGASLSSGTTSLGASASGHNGVPVAQIADARAAAPIADSGVARASTPTADPGVTRGTGDSLRSASSEVASPADTRAAQQAPGDGIGSDRPGARLTGDSRIGEQMDQPRPGHSGPDKPVGPEPGTGRGPEPPVPQGVSAWQPSHPEDVVRAVDHVKGDVGDALAAPDKNSKAWTQAVHEQNSQRLQRWNDLDPAMRDAIVTHETRPGHYSELGDLKGGLPPDVQARFVEHNLQERFAQQHPECNPAVIRDWAEKMDAHLRDPENHPRPRLQDFENLPDTSRHTLPGEIMRSIRLDSETRAVDRIWHERYDPDPGAGPRHLLRFNPREFGGDGEIIMGIGDLHAPKEIAVYTPGIRSTAMSFDGIVADAENLHIRASELKPDMPRLTVAYLGYDAPSGIRILGQTVTPAFAEAGGHRLAHDVAALHASFAGNPTVHLIGHSYGSTTTAFAGAGGRLGDYVHSVTLAGSPGAGPLAHARDFDVGDRVYVASSSKDIVTKFGSSPQRGYPLYGRIGDLPIRGDLLHKFGRVPVVGPVFDGAGRVLDRFGHYLNSFANPGPGKILGHFGLGIDPADPHWGGVRVRAEYLAPELPGLISSHTNMFASEVIGPDGRPVSLREDPHARVSESLGNLGSIVTDTVDKLTFEAPHDPQHRFAGDPAGSRPAEPATGYPGPSECVRQGAEWFSQQHPDARIGEIADHHGRGVSSAELERALNSPLREATTADIGHALQQGRSVWVVEYYDPAALPPGHPGAHLSIVEPHAGGLHIFDNGAATLVPHLPEHPGVAGRKIVTFNPDGTPTHPFEHPARQGEPGVRGPAEPADAIGRSVDPQGAHPDGDGRPDWAALPDDSTTPSDVAPARPDPVEVVTPVLERYGVSLDEFMAMQERAAVVGRDQLVVEFSAEHLQMMYEARMAHPHPGPADVIQKVISEPAVKTILDQVANPGSEYGGGGPYKADGVGGCVSVASDAAALRTPSDLLRGLRLDYGEWSPYEVFTTTDHVYVIEGQVAQGNLSVPNGRITNHLGIVDARTKDLDEGAPPHTGTGYAGDGQRLNPEYLLERGRWASGAELIRIDPDGSRHPVARLEEIGGEPTWVSAKESGDHVVDGWPPHRGGEWVFPDSPQHGTHPDPPDRPLHRGAESVGDPPSTSPPIEPGRDPAVAARVFGGAAFNTEAGVAFFDPTDVTMRSAAGDVRAIAGEFTIDVHGDAHAVSVWDVGGVEHRMSPHEFGEVIRTNTSWDGQSPIRLLSCDTGAGTHPFAAELARELGVPVTAPDRPVWTFPDGREPVVTGFERGRNGELGPRIPPDGQWNRFTPDGAHTETAARPRSVDLARLLSLDCLGTGHGLMLRGSGAHEGGSDVASHRSTHGAHRDEDLRHPAEDWHRPAQQYEDPTESRKRAAFDDGFIDETGRVPVEEFESGDRTRGWPHDDTGYRIREEDLGFMGIDETQVDWWERFEAPLGMTPEQFREFTASLTDALTIDGIDAAHVDIRLQGSSAQFFSGPHKDFPTEAELAGQPSALARLQEWMGDRPQSDRPSRVPFDAKHLLGVFDETGEPEPPSDYDVQFSSDAMVEKARQEWETMDPDTRKPLVNQKYDFVDKNMVRQTFPALYAWKDRWEERLGREVAPAVFGSLGPPDKSAFGSGISTHFRDTDWIINRLGDRRR
ncbi:alpha/beta hydrolase [Mycobacterium vicinigordonae]|uniref:Uncharacterized protein n=1 Tax=Mycobacterium vicinigordonae TaxID=1719132 RepID=A0A7D6HS03_9MYCO|nr:alpha/beta hydrolase [Mycobacterium vicinigordonae]QLL06012.1 hypothetical protein H0P51_19805 [Mycobacterium vicinigordonae]